MGLMTKDEKRYPHDQKPNGSGEFVEDALAPEVEALNVNEKKLLRKV